MQLNKIIELFDEYIHIISLTWQGNTQTVRITFLCQQFAKGLFNSSLYSVKLLMMLLFVLYNYFLFWVCIYLLMLNQIHPLFCCNIFLFPVFRFFGKNHR